VLYLKAQIPTPRKAVCGQVPVRKGLQDFRRWIVIPGRKGILVALALVLIFSMAMFGCARTQELDVVTAEPAAEEPAAQPEPMVVEHQPEPAPSMAQEPEPVIMGTPDFDVSMMTDVFFAYDRSDLTMESRDRLAANAKLLKSWKAGVVIEGHCDERGTNEYNLGLGERRANAVKSYLVSLGVDASKIRTISYGEERPFARGHNEDAWKLNRRAHFSLP
jgi:peptidoglycan-associated lipoprotein